MFVEAESQIRKHVLDLCTATKLSECKSSAIYPWVSNLAAPEAPCMRKNGVVVHPTRSFKSRELIR